MTECFAHGYALLIGVGRSAYADWSLPVTVKDVTALQAILENPALCGYSAANIRVLTDDRATRQAILEGLDWLRQQATTDPEATIIIYYSGHGWLDQAHDRYYLVQHDIKPFNLAGSALAAEDFTAALRQIPAERLLVVIDSCHAEGMATAKSGEAGLELPANFVVVAPNKGLFDPLSQQKGRAVFTSCAGTQKSWIRKDQQLSIFTHHLIEALQGAANHPGETTVKVSHLITHLDKTVAASAMAEYQAAQEPRFDFQPENFAIALLQAGKGLPTGGWEAVKQQASVPQISVQASGDHSVAIGGSVSGGTIVPGNQNSVKSNNVSQYGSTNVNIYNVGNLSIPNSLPNNEPVKSGQIETDSSKPELDVYENPPRRVTSRFVGRTQELEILHQKLWDDQLPIVAIVGMPGVGKTELALKYAQDNKQQYQAGICWLHARDGNLGAQIIKFAQDYFQIEQQHKELLEQVKYCWRQWPLGKALIVLDDVPSYQAIKPYLPLKSRFKVLITTIINLDGDGLHVLKLDTLDKDEISAFDLLGKWSGEEKLVCDLKTRQDPTYELCQRLGYLPLALERAGRYVKKHKISLSEMLNLLEGKALDYLQIQPNDKTLVNIERGIKEVFQLAWEDLNEYPEAQRLGCLLSLLALAPIPWDLVQQIWGENDVRKLKDARIALDDLHLLTGEDPYQLHQLIREFFQEQLRQNQDAHTLKQKTCRIIATLARQIPEDPTQQDLLQFLPLIPHIYEISTTLIDELSNENFVYPLQGLCRFYEGQGSYDSLQEFCEEYVEKSRERFGEKHLSFASCLRHLATVYFYKDLFSEAEDLYQQVLDIRRELLPKQHADLADSLDDLALFLKDQDQLADAEPLYRESLTMRRELFGEEHSAVADSLNNLGVLYTEQSKYEEAELLLIQALELRQRLSDRDKQPRIVTSLNNLASCYRYQGYFNQEQGNFAIAREKFTLAEKLYLQALKLSKQLLPENHSDVAIATNNLAQIYSDQAQIYNDPEKFNLAYPLLQQALEVQKNIYGERHRYVANTLNNLASCCQGLDFFEQAEDYYKRALEIRRGVLSENHFDIGISLNNLSRLYFFLEEHLEEALILQEQAAEIMKISRGLEDGFTQQVLKNLEEIKKKIASVQNK